MNREVLERAQYFMGPGYGTALIISIAVLLLIAAVSIGIATIYLMARSAIGLDTEPVADDKPKRQPQLTSEEFEHLTGDAGELVDIAALGPEKPKRHEARLSERILK